MSNQNFLSIDQDPRPAAAFRDDLREPTVAFGRCSITGDWGKVVNIDTGDIAIEAPVTDSGVKYDPVTGEVEFTEWRPVVFAGQVSFSEAGLERLLAWAKDQSSPIPSITPNLVYKWQVLYKDGGALCQFEHDLDGGEVEINSRNIEWARGVQQISVVPRHTNEGSLPNYTYVPESGKFFCNGVELDVDYDGAMPENAQVVYCRKVTHTFASAMGEDLSRQLTTAHTTVLQILGWHVDGVPGVEATNQNPCCLISIDPNGNWRPWKQFV